MTQTELSDIKVVLSRFTTDSAGSWVVTFNGQKLKFHSNKSVWAKKNHASAAFTNFIGNLYGSWKNRTTLEQWGFKNSRQLAHYLIENEIVKIEQI